MARSSILLLVLCVPLVLCANTHTNGHHHDPWVDYTHYVDELWNKVNYDHDTLHFTRVELHDFLVFADTNKDRSITRQEYVEAVTKDDTDLTAFAHGLFDTFDANGDHNLTLEDTTQLYKRMDADGIDIAFPYP